MYPEILPYLRCPDHREYALLLDGPRYSSDGEVIDGYVTCPCDGRRYPIVDGIAQLLASALPESPAQAINQVPLTAWGYERLWRHRALTLLAGERFGYQRELALVTGLLEPSRPGLYVDSACSNGLYARAIAQNRTAAPGHVVGIDHSLPMLRQARAFARRAGLRISYVCAKAEVLPFGDSAAAGVVMGGSLNEITHPADALAEFRRLLAPEGRGVIMSLVQAETLIGRLIQTALAPGGVTFWPLEGYNRLLQDAGLRLLGQWRYRIVVFSSVKRNV